MFDEQYDDYHQPTAADEIFFEARTKLIDSLKDSVKQYIESFKSENLRLELENNKMKEKVLKLDKERRELNLEKESFRRTLRHEKLNELMNDLNVDIYTVSKEYREKEKCNKCDENRKIKYKTPSGKISSEDCECSTRIYDFVVKEMVVCEMRRSDSGNKVYMWYELYDKGDGYKRTTTVKQFCDDLQHDEIVGHYDIHFKSKEKCQAYCNYLNSKKGGING